MRVRLNELRSVIIEALLNAYDVLGVPYNATDDQIKTAWKKLAIANHPDKGGSHGKMVDINNAKDRLLNRSELMMRGSTFKGYEDPKAPQSARGAAPAPSRSTVMEKCSQCGRNVKIENGAFVNHYTQQGGNVKCSGSGSQPRQAGGSHRNASNNPWNNWPGANDEWRASSFNDEYEFNNYTRNYRKKGDTGPGTRTEPKAKARGGYYPPPGPPPGNPYAGTWRASGIHPGFEYNEDTGNYREEGSTGQGFKSQGEASQNAKAKQSDPTGSTAGDWSESGVNHDYEYNSKTGKYRKKVDQQSTGTSESPPRTDSDNFKRYFVFVGGNSRKFWEIEVKNGRITTKWGKIGSEGQTNTEYYSSWVAGATARRKIRSKLDAGYVEGSRDTEWAADEAPGAQTPNAGPKREPSGQPKKDTYKVYPWKSGRRVVRVGGKLFGTEEGGRLKDGGNTKFNANDRARITPDNGKMKVGMQDSDHTQTWDPVDEVRNIVDEMIIEEIVRIAEGLEPGLEDAIEEKVGEPEFQSVENFVMSKLDEDLETFDFIELHALARTIYREDSGANSNAEAPEAFVKELRSELETFGLKFMPRQVQRAVRGAMSNPHGTHPFANSGSGGSGFGNSGFRAHGGGPGAIGGGTTWDPNDPKNLGMGAKRRK